MTPETSFSAERHLLLDTEEFNGVCCAYRMAQPDPIEAYHELLMVVQKLIDAEVAKVSLKFVEAAAPPKFAA